MREENAISGEIPRAELHEVWQPYHNGIKSIFFCKKGARCPRVFPNAFNANRLSLLQFMYGHTVLNLLMLSLSPQLHLKVATVLSLCSEAAVSTMAGMSLPLHVFVNGAHAVG